MFCRENPRTPKSWKQFSCSYLNKPLKCIFTDSQLLCHTISHRGAWKAAGGRRRSLPWPATGVQHWALHSSRILCWQRPLCHKGSLTGAAGTWYHQGSNAKSFQATNHVQKRAFNLPQGQLHPPPTCPTWGASEEPFIQSTPACQQDRFCFSFSVVFASHFWSYTISIPFLLQ